MIVRLVRVWVWTAWLWAAAGQAPGEGDGEAGYIAGEDYLMEPLDVDESGMFALCPTDRVMRTRGGCGAGVGDDSGSAGAGAGEQLECVRLHCCAGYVYVARRCLPEGTAPCGGRLALCEQRCRAQAGLVWCTCYPGYAFSAARYRQRIPPYCLDVDECAEADHGGCESRCVNTPGGFHCECNEGTLAPDGRHCLPSATKEPSRVSGESEAALWAGLQALAAQLRQLQAAPRPHYPLSDEAFAEGGSVYRVLDSTAPLEGGYCRCERGPRGPPGAPGMVGEKGDRGERGPRGAGGLGGRRALDAVLALVGELRAELASLRLALSRGERPPPPLPLPHQPLAERAFRPSPRTYTHSLQDGTQFVSVSARNEPEEVSLRSEAWGAGAADGRIEALYDILADLDVNANAEGNYDDYD